MWFFNRRAAELEIKNRRLVEADKLRMARVEKLERQIESLTAEKAALTHRVAGLEDGYRRLEADNQRLDAENRQLIHNNRLLEGNIQRVEDNNRQLEDNIRRLEDNNRRLEENDRELEAGKPALNEVPPARPIPPPPPPPVDTQTIELERAFYRQQAEELKEHNRQLTDAATRYALWAKELDAILRAADLYNAERAGAWTKHIGPLHKVKASAGQD